MSRIVALFGGLLPFRTVDSPSPVVICRGGASLAIDKPRLNPPLHCYLVASAAAAAAASVHLFDHLLGIRWHTLALAVKSPRLGCCITLVGQKL